MKLTNPSYKANNQTNVAPKEMGTYSLFEANQLLCEGRCYSDQGIVWKRNETSNEGYLHKGLDYLQDLEHEGLKGFQADEE